MSMAIYRFPAIVSSPHLQLNTHVSGYQLFFVSTAVYVQTSAVVFKLEQQRFFPAAIRRSPVWWALKVAWTNCSLTYLAMSFIVSALPGLPFMSHSHSV